MLTAAARPLRGFADEARSTTEGGSPPFDPALNDRAGAARSACTWHTRRRGSAARQGAAAAATGSIPQVAGRHWCRPQARRRQFYVPCRTRHRVALQRVLPGGMGARTQAARLGLSISRECHRGGLKSACRCLFVQPFVRVVLGEAGSFVRFEVFEHQANVLRVEDVGPRQSFSASTWLRRRWAAAPGVPWKYWSGMCSSPSERYHDFATPAGREEVRVHQLAGPPGPDPRAPGRTSADRDRGFRTVRPRSAQQSPPESPPPAQARQLRPRYRSAVRNSFRGGGPPFHPRLPTCERHPGQELETSVRRLKLPI